MSRSARLLQLLDTLRRARLPQTGPELAQALGVSLRTLYRDIATLRTQGADILGDPGIGFEMRPGFLLPPLMFNADELEALLLGARWASLQADAPLAQAAESALERIRSCLPLPLLQGGLRLLFGLAGVQLGHGGIEPGGAFLGFCCVIPTYRGSSHTTDLGYKRGLGKCPARSGKSHTAILREYGRTVDQCLQDTRTGPMPACAFDFVNCCYTLHE